MNQPVPQFPDDRGLIRHFPRRLIAAVLTTSFALVLLLRFDPGVQPVATTLAAAVGAPSSDASTAPSSLATSRSSGNGSGGAQASAVPAPSSGSTASGPTEAPTPTTSTAQVVLTGSAVGTRYGTVQVQVTLEGSTIVDVTALDLPSGGRDGQISAYAEPRLRSEALQAQSANIDTVSGATYTSRGYISSLQSALDQAA